MFARVAHVGVGGRSGVSPSVWVFPFQVFSTGLCSCWTVGHVEAAVPWLATATLPKARGRGDVTCFGRFKFYRWHPDDSIFTARISDIIIIIIIIIIMFIYCNWVVTRWHWLFYM